tara:strand:- start:58 stop:792 length:735 start_codon:yes stop_codon:yes gene_type:complete
MKTVIIIQARLGSTRLPNKILLEVLNTPLLQFQLERLNYVTNVDDIIIATTSNPLDDDIVSLSKNLGCKFFRGSEHDVLDRYYQAACHYNADCIVRINSDCPLIDPMVVDKVINVYKSNYKEYDYVSNILEKGYPIGFHTEVFSKQALSKAFLSASDSDEREHVTPYIYRNPRIFKLKSIVPNIDMSNYRLTLDYSSDFEVISNVIQNLYPLNPKFGINEIVDYLNFNPNIAQINSHIQKKQII